MEHTELYKILGVSNDSTDAEIKKNYRKLAKEFHPDKNPEAGDKFKEISFAYEILSDTEKRKVYDRYGLKGLQEGSEGASDAFEIFTHWFPFGNAHGAGPGTSNSKSRAAAQVVVKLEVTLEEIFNGNVNKKVEYKRSSYCSKCFGQGGPKEAIEKCEACNGTGRTATYSFVGTFMNAFDSVCRVCCGRGNTIKEDLRCGTCSGDGLIDEQMEREVIVEKGAPNMLKIPFRGEGNQPQSGERGDLVVVLVQADHPVFLRRQNDLFLRDIRINLTQALCGYVHCFQHLDGRKVCITTRPGHVIRHGDMMVVSGEGMPLRNNPFERGDLFVEFRVEFPDSDFATGEQLALLEKLLPPRQHIAVPSDAEEVALSDIQPYGEGAQGGAHGGDDDEDGVPHFEGVQCQTA